MVRNSKKIKEVLAKGVEEILPSKKGLFGLLGKRKIKVYQGIDPTYPYLHLGHTIPLRKLQEFSDLGHEVFLLIGNFTAQIGDPSGREEARRPLTKEEVKKNMETYKKQASKILDFSKVKIVYNADWLSGLKFGDVLKLAGKFSVQQMLEREMFQKRIKEKRPIWLHEFLYPLMQGYDSVHLNVDLEIGGRDQVFNMLCGRELQRLYNKKEKFVLTLPILEGLDGRKMSKTFQNTVNLTDEPNDMYGKIMSLRDDLIIKYFELCTDLPLNKIKEMERELKFKRVNPRDLKAKLAREIVKIYYGKEAAGKAEEEFERVFKGRKFPKKIPEIKIKEKSLNILDLLLKTKLVSSKSEAKRLILQKGVEINRVLKDDWREVVEIKKGMIIKVGKRRFVKLI